jgi:hypothetical protein
LGLEHEPAHGGAVWIAGFTNAGGITDAAIYMIWHETHRHDAAHGWLREVVVTELTAKG